MAISGSQDYSRNRDQVIRTAYELIGALGEGQTLETSKVNFAVTMLNMMLKTWNTDNINLWLHGEGAIVLDKDTVSYTLKTASDTNVAAAGGFIKAEIGSDEIAAQTSLTVDSSTNMAASDVIFIELDDGTLDETSISSITDSTTIVIASGLTSAASEGNHIYVYTTADDAITGIKRVEQIRIRNASGNDRVLEEMSRQTYYSLHNKTLEAAPTGYFIDYQSANPILYVWPEPDDRKEYLFFTYVKSIDDMDSPTDDFDLPQEWLETITFNLAVRLAYKYNKGKRVKEDGLEAKANELYEKMQSWDGEPVDLQFISED